MIYNYIVISTEGMDREGLEKILNFNGKNSYHIIATFGKLIIMEQKEEEINESENLLKELGLTKSQIKNPSSWGQDPNRNSI